MQKLNEFIQKIQYKKINDINYNFNDLNPSISSDAMEYHYENLAKGYARRLDKGIGDTRFNMAGVFLHNKLFEQYMKPRSNNTPKGLILEFINDKFQSFDNFKKKFQDVALSIQGSGWCYLSMSGEIKTIQNHAIRQDILLIIDMWEHAFALDYKWKKDRYLENQWKIIDWQKINTRLM